MYIAEKNNICDYSCITVRLLPPAYCHNAIITARHNNARVIPAARPITNVFYFECIIHLDTRSFPRNSIISITTSSNRLNAKIFLFISSLPPRDVQFPTRVIHTCLTIYGHIPLLEREREREREFAFFFTTNTFVLYGHFLRLLSSIV